MALKQVRITFAGSFQCRLATDPDPTSSSRSHPYGDIRQPPAIGWTFDYNEAPFNRVIRCHSPVQLRSALLDPFEPVRVTRLETQSKSLGPFEMPWVTVPADPLLGQTVSLGDQAVFDSQAGGGASFEAVLNCKLSIGTLLTAVPTAPPRLTGILRKPEWVAEYNLRKPAAIAGAVATGGMATTRQKVLTEPSSIPFAPPPRFENYAQFFGAQEETQPVGAEIDFIPAGATGVMAQLLLGWSWTLSLTFSRFDGDTLTGRMTGTLAGLHSDL
jgi:hypothetical protein